MKFGRTDRLETVDFRLPADPPGTLLTLEKFDDQAPGATRFYVGATGWSMKEWVGKTYPKGAKSGDFLKYYGQQFNTIELNTTHYRIPDQAVVQRWHEQTPDDFRFCPKIPQTLSHSRNLGLDSPAFSLFCTNIRLLEEKLGCCFLQLPPFFGTNRIGLLEEFLERFPTSIPLAVEVRHESWFQSEDASDALFDLLKTHNRTAVITDVAGRRDVAHMHLTNGTAMLRWVGNGLHESDYTRTDEWIARLKQWAVAGLKECYIFPHEPDNILAPDMAQYWVQQLQEQLGAELRGPEFYQKDEGSQMSLF